MGEEKLPEIRHKRWRHKKRGYEVEVLGVYNHGLPVTHRTVKVDRTQFKKEPHSWGAERFVQEFEPMGRPFRAKTIWEHLRNSTP